MELLFYFPVFPLLAADQEYVLVQFIQDRVVEVKKSSKVQIGDDNIPRALWENNNEYYPCTIIDRCDIDDMGNYKYSIIHNTCCVSKISQELGRISEKIIVS